MRCPFCGHDDTQVKDSRPSEDNSAIRRRRHCLECGGRFTTFERVQLRELVVLKKNGRREPFDRDKLERSLAHALRKRAYPAKVVTLSISDVPGDDPAVIGSGPTIPDPSTLADARAIAARYGLELPDAARRALEDPANETPKRGDVVFAATA